MRDIPLLSLVVLFLAGFALCDMPLDVIPKGCRGLAPIHKCVNNSRCGIAVNDDPDLKVYECVPAMLEDNVPLIDNVISYQTYWWFEKDDVSVIERMIDLSVADEVCESSSFFWERGGRNCSQQLPTAWYNGYPIMVFDLVVILCVYISIFGIAITHSSKIFVKRSRKWVWYYCAVAWFPLTMVTHAMAFPTEKSVYFNKLVLFAAEISVFSVAASICWLMLEVLSNYFDKEVKRAESWAEQFSGMDEQQLQVAHVEQQGEEMLAKIKRMTSLVFKLIVVMALALVFGSCMVGKMLQDLPPSHVSIQVLIVIIISVVFQMPMLYAGTAKTRVKSVAYYLLFLAAIATPSPFNSLAASASEVFAPVAAGLLVMLVVQLLFPFDKGTCRLVTFAVLTLAIIGGFWFTGWLFIEGLFLKMYVGYLVLAVAYCNAEFLKKNYGILLLAIVVLTAVVVLVLWRTRFMLEYKHVGDFVIPINAAKWWEPSVLTRVFVFYVPVVEVGFQKAWYIQGPSSGNIYAKESEDAEVEVHSTMTYQVSKKSTASFTNRGIANLTIVVWEDEDSEEELEYVLEEGHSYNVTCGTALRTVKVGPGKYHVNTTLLIQDAELIVFPLARPLTSFIIDVRKDVDLHLTLLGGAIIFRLPIPNSWIMDIVLGAVFLSVIVAWLFLQREKEVEVNEMNALHRLANTNAESLLVHSKGTGKPAKGLRPFAAVAQQIKLDRSEFPKGLDTKVLEKKCKSANLAIVGLLSVAAVASPLLAAVQYPGYLLYELRHRHGEGVIGDVDFFNGFLAVFANLSVLAALLVGIVVVFCIWNGIFERYIFYRCLRQNIVIKFDTSGAVAQPIWYVISFFALSSLFLALYANDLQGEGRLVPFIVTLVTLCRLLWDVFNMPKTLLPLTMFLDCGNNSLSEFERDVRIVDEGSVSQTLAEEKKVDLIKAMKQLAADGAGNDYEMRRRPAWAFFYVIQGGASEDKTFSMLVLPCFIISCFFLLYMLDMSQKYSHMGVN